MTTVDPRPDVQALRAEIARTRAALGETVEALAAKADVKARLREKADDVKGRATDRVRTLAGRAQARAGALAAQVQTRAGAAAERAGALAGKVQDQAAQAASGVAERAGSTAGTVTATVRDPEWRAKLRRPVPMAVIGAAAVATTAIAVLALRNRHR